MGWQLWASFGVWALFLEWELEMGFLVLSYFLPSLWHHVICVGKRESGRDTGRDFVRCFECLRTLDPPCCVHIFLSLPSCLGVILFFEPERNGTK